MCTNELVQAIRQIPFRIMAEKAGIDENIFVDILKNVSAGIVFMDDDCEYHFNIIAYHIYWSDFLRFQCSMFNKRKEKSELYQKESKRFYCKATEVCTLMLKYGLADSKKFREMLSEISPSTTSKNFQDYCRISYLFYSDEAKHSNLGNLYPELVEFILDYHLNEENLFACIASELDHSKAY